MKKGLYQQLISEDLSAALATLVEQGLQFDDAPVEHADLPERLGAFFAARIAHVMQSVPSGRKTEVALEMSHRIASALAKFESSPQLSSTRLAPQIRDLRAVYTADSQSPSSPLTPLTETALLTNARGEPGVGHELQTEIESADRIDLVLAFIRWTGIRHFLEPFRRHTEAGRTLRVLTTTYTNSTEARALEALAELGAEIKVSYDETLTRLHAKAWLFHRATGFSTVYIGSSNLTHSAQVSGIEWNVRASETGNAGLVEKFEATFESYWQSRNFEDYDAHTFAAVTRRNRDTGVVDLTPFEIRPYPFQAHMLEQLTLARRRGEHWNLLVAATGTGKTVIAALDYKSLCSATQRPRLLFVAHRKEILEQSRSVFRHVLRAGDFGEYQFGGHMPADSEHVFASIQSLHSDVLETLDPGHFDVIIVDEFHHAAAASYERLLNHFKPMELLGLTATPERTDGGDVLGWFGGRIAAELRLWDALEQQLLSPFHYFGVADETDLSQVSWQGGNYDSTELTNVYTADDFWVGKVITAARDNLADVQTMKAIGFCVSIKHANFMAERFRAAGISAQPVTSETSVDDRNRFRQQLAAGELNVLFTVDLFNEGVDLPGVDTLLMLRPTASATIFLQQLGRGLRRSQGKDVLTVLDFVGLHRREFRFYQRFQAITGGARRDVERSIESGFPHLPAGCEIRLDRQASEHVLANLRAAVPTNARQRSAELAQLGDCSLAHYLEATGLDLQDIYSGNNYWTSLRRQAGLLGESANPLLEQRLGRGIKRLLHMDDEAHIDWLVRALSQPLPAQIESTVGVEQRRLHMLVLSWLAPKRGEFELNRALAEIWSLPDLCRELAEVLQILRSRISHLPFGSPSPTVPLVVHASYSREEVLAAYGVSTTEVPYPLQAGVYWDEANQTNLLFITLDKSDKTFSPTTRYRDYAINEALFHWESQAATSDESLTGQRYLRQRTNGSRVALFCRERRRTSDGRTAPYLFLGLADYVSHEGSQPIAITWRLHEPLPGDAFSVFRAAVA